MERRFSTSTTRFRPEVFAEEVSAATNRSIFCACQNRWPSWLDRVRLRRRFDTAERVETALNFLELASTFASIFNRFASRYQPKSPSFTVYLLCKCTISSVYRAF